MGPTKILDATKTNISRRQLLAFFSNVKKKSQSINFTFSEQKEERFWPEKKRINKGEDENNQHGEQNEIKPKLEELKSYAE